MNMSAGELHDKPDRKGEPMVAPVRQDDRHRKRSNQGTKMIERLVDANGDSRGATFADGATDPLRGRHAPDYARLFV